MNEMVERGAKAMYEHKFRNQGFKWEDSTAREEWCEMMRAAIGAMREPTEAMADIQLYLTDGSDPDFKDIWRQMIDAALK